MQNGQMLLTLWVLFFVVLMILYVVLERQQPSAAGVRWGRVAIWCAFLAVVIAIIVKAVASVLIFLGSIL